MYAGSGQRYHHIMKTVKSVSTAAATPIRLLALTFGEGWTTAECFAVMVAWIVIASWENEAGRDDGAK